MKTEQCLRDDLRERARAEGIDVEALDREFIEVGNLMTQAKINVRRKRGFIKHFIIVLGTEFLFQRLGYRHPEEEEEYQRLSQSKSKSNKK